MSLVIVVLVPIPTSYFLLWCFLYIYSNHFFIHSTWFLQNLCLHIGCEKYTSESIIAVILYLLLLMKYYYIMESKILIVQKAWKTQLYAMIFYRCDIFVEFLLLCFYYLQLLLIYINKSRSVWLYTFMCAKY